MTAEMLNDCNKKVLAQMAKERGIVGWHSMRKDQLIRALAPAPASKKDAKAKKAAERPAPAAELLRRTAATAAPSAPIPMIGPRGLDHGCMKDRIVTMVRDPYWLHTYWELSRTTLSRAQAALGQEWHAARPILRLMDVSSEDTSSTAERHVRDIAIHGGVNNWYIDVTAPPRAFRVDIGYLSQRGKFYVLARSNVVTTPKAGVADALDQHWISIQEQPQKVYHQSGGFNPSGAATELREIFEERLRRPMSYASLAGLGGALLSLGKGFHSSSTPS